ncbi:MAG: DUF3303 domain-containing protein [Dehalococcoidia bacterium]
MLCMIAYTIRDGRTSLERFLKWQAPITFISHYQSVDGRRGFAVAEGTPVGFREATAAYGDVLDFEIYPIVSIEEGVAAEMKSFAWVDSLK